MGQEVALGIWLQAKCSVWVTDAEIEKLRNSVNRQTPFDKEDWKNELCGKTGLESTVRPRGWQKGRKRGVNNQPVPL